MKNRQKGRNAKRIIRTEFFLVPMEQISYLTD